MENKTANDNNHLVLMLDSLRKLYEERENLLLAIQELKKAHDPVLDGPLESDQTDKLAEAMAKAQMEYPRLGPNSTNSFNQSKYSNLENILWTIRPIIAKHGIEFEQKIYTTRENTHWGITILRHCSGQWSKSRVRIIPETSTKSSGYQEFGKAATYQMRYAAMAMLGIRPTKDELDDDDQENAKQKEYDQFFKEPVKTSHIKPTNQETISSDELREIEYELSQLPQDKIESYRDAILSKYEVNALVDIPKVGYRYTIDKLRTIKQNLK